MANLEPNNQNQAESTEKTRSNMTLETVNGSHIFEIKRYSLLKNMQPGSHVSSDTFTVGRHDWAIYFYPYTANPLVNSVCVSVLLVLVSEASNVRVLVEITLVAQTAEKDHITHTLFLRDVFPYTLKQQGSKFGYDISRDELEASGFLRNDCLLLKCTVGVVKGHMERPEQNKIAIPPSNMAEQFTDMWMSGEGSDIVFNVGDEKVKAHKQVLAARSPVFRDQFLRPLNPNVDSVTIEDVEPSVFKAMLLYIYSDDVPGLHEITGSHLLAASGRYGLDRLKLICESRLCDEITVETVVTTLLLAEQHRCKQLKSVCLNFAAANLKAVIHLDVFKDLEERYPSLLTELLQIVAKKKRDAAPAGH